MRYRFGAEGLSISAWIGKEVFKKTEKKGYLNSAGLFSTQLRHFNDNLL